MTSKQHIDGKVGGKKLRMQVIAELGAAIVFVNMMGASNVSVVLASFCHTYFL